MSNEPVISIARTLYHVPRPQPRHRPLVQDGQPLTKRPPMRNGGRLRTQARYTVCSILNADEARMMPGWTASPFGLSGERRIAQSKSLQFRFVAAPRPDVLDSARPGTPTSSRLVTLT